MRKAIVSPQDFGKVAVLMGGWSAEREVSLWSGGGVLEALRKRKVDAHAVDPDPASILTFGAMGFDRVFNVLHGTGGEDGLVQAVLDLQGIPYTGSGVLASALAMDKLRTKRMWRAEGLPTPDYLPLRCDADAQSAPARLGLPLIIKPASEGSSVGVVKLTSAHEAVAAFHLARGDSNKEVLAERFIDSGPTHEEFTCAIVDGQALPVIRIQPDAEFYDYHAKYLSEKTRYQCPAGLSADQERALGHLCLQAFELVGGRGWGRVDFMLDQKGGPWLIEVNTVPGMTSHSLVPMAAAAVGISYEQLCWQVLETSFSSVHPISHLEPIQ